MNTKKIVVSLTCIAMFALMLTMFATFVKPAQAAEQVTIVNHQGFLDYSGYYVVYGEVKNTGDTAAKNIYVKITYSSSEGLDEDETETVIHVLLPGRKAPFAGNAAVQGSLVNSYTVELMDLTMSSEDLPKVLDIVSSSTEVNVIHNMMITGTVKNSGTETATYTRVYATFYDGPSGTGNVVAVTGATAQPTNLDPGQTGDFQMAFFVTPGKTYASYVLVAESDQYAASTEYVAATGQTSSASPSSSASLSPSPSIPEFSSTVVVALIIVAMLIVAVAAKRKQR
jgi:hypothetical protein